MKYKHEKVIRDISMLVLLATTIIMKLGKTDIQVIIAVLSFMICTFGGIYLVYKRYKLGGAFMFCIAFGLILFILGQYYHNDNFAIPVPGLLAITCILAYKQIVKSNKYKSQIKKIKIESIICITIFSIAQVVMIVLSFIK